MNQNNRRIENVIKNLRKLADTEPSEKRRRFIFKAIDDLNYAIDSFNVEREELMAILKDFRATVNELSAIRDADRIHDTGDEWTDDDWRDLEEWFRGQRNDRAGGDE